MRLLLKTNLLFKMMIKQYLCNLPQRVIFERYIFLSVMFAKFSFNRPKTASWSSRSRDQTIISKGRFVTWTSASRRRHSSRWRGLHGNLHSTLLFSLSVLFHLPFRYKLKTNLLTKSEKHCILDKNSTTRMTNKNRHKLINDQSKSLRTIKRLEFHSLHFFSYP